jgi:acetyl-CoA carboxylase carboxyl transferase subunit alpha
LATLADVPTPIVATIIGEGGSGGALALGLADYVIMLQHSVYSVASPEGAAAILWGDASKADEAAARLRLTSDDLREFGIVDEVIAEPLGGAHRDALATISSVLDAVDAALEALKKAAIHALLDSRYAKYRRIGAV